MGNEQIKEKVSRSVAVLLIAELPQSGSLGLESFPISSKLYVCGNRSAALWYRDNLEKSQEIFALAAKPLDFCFVRGGVLS